MNKQISNQIYIHWKTIVSTVVICVAIFTFIYTYTVNIKNAEISLLERQIELMEKQIRLFETQYRVLKDIVDPQSKNYSIQYPSKNTKVDTINNSNIVSKSVNKKDRDQQ